MQPIILTEFGETLVQYSHSSTTDNDNLSSLVGMHDICGGCVDVQEISKTHSCIHCRSCNLRIIIPKDIDTYFKLRHHCAMGIRGQKEQRRAMKEYCGISMQF